MFRRVMAWTFSWKPVKLGCLSVNGQMIDSKIMPSVIIDHSQMTPYILNELARDHLTLISQLTEKNVTRSCN